MKSKIIPSVRPTGSGNKHGKTNSKPVRKSIISTVLKDSKIISFEQFVDSQPVNDATK